jgi:hypothetical protein
MLTNKDDFEKCINRIQAWFNHEMLDRVPIRFAAHNAECEQSENSELNANDWKKIWFDAEETVERFIKSVKGKTFIAETFPVFWPNLGPDVYAAFYGCQLTYGAVTSWSHPCLKDISTFSNLVFEPSSNKYFNFLNLITECAIEKADGSYLLGYTDLHPGMDCVAAWRGPEQLCFDLLENPQTVKKNCEIASKDFKTIYDHFDSKIKKYSKYSTTWIAIPVCGRLHIPSCDFATMMSPKQFEEFVFPQICDEVRHATHNIFHLDGKGVARHLDMILQISQISAIQWVQGVGDDLPIMQWLPIIKKIQNSGKSVIVDLKKEELESFMQEVDPKGIFLCINETDEKIQKEIITKVLKWK